MITINDIYEWYEKRLANAPHPPNNFTPLQAIEWREQHEQEIKDFENEFRNKSFVGELLVGAPAKLHGVQKNKLTASAFYCLFSLVYQPSDRKEHRYISNPFWIIDYEIFYDEALYETVKLIYGDSMVKLEGQILKFEKGSTKTIFGGDEVTVPHYALQLKLSAINVINKQQLYSDDLDDNFKIAPRPKSKCFIATAAFGYEDKTEVIQLREFRDNVLRNSFAGKCFISTYEFLSPPFAMIIKHSNWLREITRSFLRGVILPMTKR